MASRIALAQPDLAGNEERYVVEAIRSSWISSTGPFVERFEREFAEVCGGGTVLSVSNGTTALHLALLGVGAGPGDEVVVPALTYVAAANAVRYVGAEPVFVDVDPATWCISVDAVKAAVGPRTVGIIPVHLYGHPADMDALGEIAGRHSLWIVEDAAEAHFARYKDRPVGLLGTIGTFSFYGNKILTSGEGGAVAAADSTLVAKLRQLRGQGVDPARRYFFPIVGHNFRLTNVACALLCGQLERRQDFLAKRRRIFADYRELLAGSDGLEPQLVATWAEPAPWLFSFTVDEERFGRSRDELAARLDAENIETRPLFVPMHQLPPYKDARRGGTSLEVSERLGETGLSVPTHTGMTAEDVERVAGVIAAQRG